jgi:putative nucleotidyltransferase with HDIG domain
MASEDSTMRRPTGVASAKPMPAQVNLDVYLNGIQHLPPTPSVMVKLLRIFKLADPDLDEVVKLISHDPSLTAEVLKRCNSAYFAGENPVTDIFEAISRLGFYEVYRAVVLISGARTMSLQTAAVGVKVEDLWRHSLATAVAAEVIAREISESEVAAFTAGLLHDVGKLVLASAEGGKYGTVTQSAVTESASLVELERNAFGFDNSEIGARLLERWRLPADVVAPIRHHHNLGGAGESIRLTATLALADSIAHQLEEPAAHAAGLTPCAEAAVVLKLAPAAVTAIIEKVCKRLEQDSQLMAAAG